VTSRNARPPLDPDRGVFSISTTAQILGVGVQTLRLYEQRGLIEPTRTDGGTRRYSHLDLDRLHHVAELVELGLNLTGVALVLQLEAENDRLRAELARLRVRD
jgi:MerR family transcriptional regulator, heat shock protein HspR